MKFTMVGLFAANTLNAFSVVFISTLLMQLSSCYDVDFDEVQALRDAARDLGKPDWNCTDIPCTNGTDGEPAETCWYKKSDATKILFVNQVTCYPYYGKMHVINISLKGQDLAGVLPKSLAKLRYLKKIDLSRNLLTGSIPPEWASMKNLTYLSVMANRLSGPIPGYLGNIISLIYISFESNLFSGTVPAELGLLVNLNSLTLSDNNLTGKLPEQLVKLRNLNELRISSNNFHGRLPDYFDSWRELEKLLTFCMLKSRRYESLNIIICYIIIVLNAGKSKVPSSIFLLNYASEIRISDLNGEGFRFPSQQNWQKLTRLVLRNCNISGFIPTYIANISLKLLDLSFNNLTGSIPSDGFTNFLNVYLMHNMLTGSLPSWTRSNYERIIDLSYNLLDETNMDPQSCRQERLSFSGDRNLESSLCLRSYNCSKARYSLHINCGGKEVTIGKTTYEQDDMPGSAAIFFPATAEWGFSSSGEYWFTEDRGKYIAKGVSSPGTKDWELYKEARLSPTSLTYYGRCLAKDNYTVILRFLELIFANNKSFSSLGRRKFDIYIQEANETHIPVKLVFPNIPVNNTIEIRLYYAGKGSAHIPSRESGSYGPLISAISVQSEFKAPLSKKRIMWISVGVASLSLCLIFTALSIVRWKHSGEDMRSREEYLLGLDLQTGKFTFRQIRASTNNFDAACKLGEGGFGTVYLGTLLDGSQIAVKQLSCRSSQGHREFINEIGMISSLNHPNLVKLYGCCVEGSQLLLIYEYMENNNLALALFGADDCELRLDWPTRRKICIGIARGLTFLHEESTIKVVHRDIKATNILLDREFNPKISDFGLARLDEEENTHISTRIAGTVGYMAPEYALWGYLTYKADVFSFGIVLLEIVAGRCNMKFRQDGNHFCLQDRAFILQQQKGDLMELVDPRLGTNYKKEEALMMIKVALLCTNPSSALRPTMSAVLKMLEGSMSVQDSTVDSNEWLYQASRVQKQQMGENETQSLVLSAGAPRYEYDSSSRSDLDLYPVNL